MGPYTSERAKQALDPSIYIYIHIYIYVCIYILLNICIRIYICVHLDRTQEGHGPGVGHNGPAHNGPGDSGIVAGPQGQSQSHSTNRSP